MITKQKIIDDAELQLLGSDPSDDSALEKDLLAQWATYYLNNLVTQELNQRMSRGEMIPGVYIKRAECQATVIEGVACGGDCQDRISVTLPEQVLTLKNDAGIMLVQTDEGDEVKKASVETLVAMKNMRFTKPSNSNMLFYHQGNKLYIEGITTTDVPFESVHIWYVPSQDLLSLDDSDEVLISDDIYPSLIASIVATGKQTLYGTQVDVASDGVDTKQAVYHQQIANPTNQTEQ